MEESKELEKDDGMRLRKSITLLGAVSIGFANIIGAGIFVSPKGVLAGSGSTGLCLLVWFTCGVLSLVGGMGLAELGTMMPRSGGLFYYIREIYGDLAGFLVQWVNIVLQQTAGQAICFLVIANYVLQPFFPDLSCGIPSSAVQLIAVVANVLAAFINCRTVRLVSVTQVIFFAMNLLCFGFLITVGVVHYFRGTTDSFENLFSGSRYDQLGPAFYAGLYTYAGWYNLNLVVEEMQKPSRNLPLAQLLSIVMVTTVFLSINFAYFAVLSPDEILTSNAVAVTFGEKTLGSFGWLIPVIVVMSTLGSASGSLLTISRMCFAAARSGHQPAIFAYIHQDRRTPVPAIILVTAITTIYICVTDVYRLISFCSFAAWASTGFALAGVVILRWTRPNVHRPYKVNILLPIVFVLACTFLVFMNAMTETVDTAIGLGIVLLGIPVYYIFVKEKFGTFNRSKLLKTMWNFTQKMLMVVQEDSSDVMMTSASYHSLADAPT